MAYPPIVIRIKSSDSATDWTVQRPEQLTFRDALAAISQVIPDSPVPAFEYEDEEGDRITVRHDEDMTNMLKFYLETIGCYADGHPVPLVIYPKVGKSPGKRNIHGLKIETKSNPETTTTPPADPDPGSRKRSGDIREILACGTIADSDLHYLEILGSGNCGTVNRALHKPSGTVIAVKVIPLDTVSVDAQKQIIAELEILYRCNSNLIIGFYGAFFLENRISICTEFMDGGSLDKYGKIPETILGRIAVSVVRGLQYLWSLKIMHRDVKPSNILINTQGQLKLCDFGVSIQLINSIAKTFIGTNAYMAPERICGEEYSINSEVWSLGISVFEMALGRFPYESAHKPSANAIDLWKSIVEKDPPRLPRGEFSDEFVDFVAQCMRKAPLARSPPEALMRHPFIAAFDDRDTEVVATWVRKRLEEILNSKVPSKTYRS